MSEKSEARNARARALGFKSDHDRWKHKAMAQGYRNRDDREARRASGHPTPTDVVYRIDHPNRQIHHVGGQVVVTTTARGAGWDTIARQLVAAGPAGTVTGTIGWREPGGRHREAVIWGNASRAGWVLAQLRRRYRTGSLGDRLRRFVADQLRKAGDGARYRFFAPASTITSAQFTIS